MKILRSLAGLALLLALGACGRSGHAPVPTPTPRAAEVDGVQMNERRRLPLDDGIEETPTPEEAPHAAP